MDFLFGLDLDGVCYQFEKTARYMLRKRISDRGVNPPAELSVASRGWNAIRDVLENADLAADWEWLWAEAVGQGLFRYGHVVTGAIEGVQALNELGEVVVVTHRPKAAVHDTLTWLSFMFDKAPLAGVHIQSNGQKKSEVNPRPAIYIDDATHVADDIISNTSSSVILFDQPWNQDFGLLSPRLYRAVGWQEVIKIATMLKEAKYE